MTQINIFKPENRELNLPAGVYAPVSKADWIITALVYIIVTGITVLILDRFVVSLGEWIK